MNHRDKGQRHEKAVANWLEDEGWKVERNFKKVAYIQGRLITIGMDLFGAFDIVAIRPVKWRHPEVKFVQVTSGDNTANRKRKCFKVWPESEVWEHIERGKYWIHRIDGSGRMIDIWQS